jgi:hypothetical protein
LSLGFDFDFLSAFFDSLLSGMEMAIHYGVRSPAELLDERSQLQLRQALVKRLRILVPAFFLPTAVFAIAAAALQVTSADEWIRILGVLALMIWVAIRVVGTVPINSATLTWPLDAPPAEWKTQVDRAERFHDVGVGAAIGSFACFLLAFGLATAMF